MKKLEHLILDRIDEPSLYFLYLNYPGLKVDDEWKRRLLSCDPEKYLPVLDFLYSQNIEKTLQKSLPLNSTIKQGLYGVRKCFPWKVGVIYNYQTGQVKSLEIRMGYVNKRYRNAGSPVLFSWLDANENRVLLREIISSNSNNSIFSLKLEEEKSNLGRDLILDNKKLGIEVAIIKATHRGFRSFPHQHPLSGGEEFVVYPCRIFNENKSIKIYDSPNTDNVQIVSFSNIPITFSPDVSKYLAIISQI